jgi:hydrogenase maturation protease
VVIGIGNEYRRDDGIGPRVVAELTGTADVELRIGDGEPGRMLDLWSGAGLAVVIDAFHDPARRAGTWLELSLDEAAGAAESPAAGTHGVGLGGAVALGRVLDRLPDRLVVLAVCGREFGFGTGLSAPVEAAVPAVAIRVRELIGRYDGSDRDQ